jgi:Family of unknown function (DUF5719)
MRPSDVPAALAVPAAVGLALLGGAGADTPVTAGSQSARTVPVTQTTLLCPTLRAEASTPESVAAGVLSPPLRRSPDLRTRPVRVSAAGHRVAVLARRGATWSGTAPAVAQGLRADAEGGLAAGLGAAAGAVFDDAARGLAAATCTPPASHWWFVGTASTPGRSAVLHLANPSSDVAVADVAFHGPDGPLASAAGQGIAVPAGGRTSVPLADLVPGVPAVTLEVTTHQGELAAAVTEVATDGLEPAGVEMVPAAAAPRRTTALTGVPGGPAEHTLSVTNAGAGSTVVQVEVLGTGGAFTPTGLEQISVPAGGVAQTRLPAAVLDGAAGLRLSADQPVAAAVRTSTGSPLSDQSYAVSATPVGEAAVPVLPGLRAELVLSGAGHAASTVDVVSRSAEGGAVDRRTLEVHGGQTRSVPLGPDAASAQLRSSGPGPLLAAVRWSEPDARGTLSSGFPLAPLRVDVHRPPVRYDLVRP